MFTNTEIIEKSFNLLNGRKHSHFGATTLPEIQRAVDSWNPPTPGQIRAAFADMIKAGEMIKTSRNGYEAYEIA